MPLAMKDAQIADLRFMQRMLYEAVFWRESPERPSLEEALGMPEVAMSLADWGDRDGDTGVIAADGEMPVGAAWYRYWTPERNIRGFVGDTIPVVVIGVEAACRRRGIGSLLLESLIERAALQSVPTISLAVSKDNHALGLYRKLGFQVHTDSGSSLFMTRRVRE